MDCDAVVCELKQVKCLVMSVFLLIVPPILPSSPNN